MDAKRLTIDECVTADKWEAYLAAKAETRFAEAEFDLADGNHVEQAIYRLCACEAAEKNAFAEYQAARIRSELP